MRNMVIGIILGVVLVIGLLSIGTSLIAQQNRLQIQGRVDGVDQRISATCDTGNGTMIYTVSTGNLTGGVGLGLLPGGCTKN